MPPSGARLSEGIPCKLLKTPEKSSEKCINVLFVFIGEVHAVVSQCQQTGLNICNLWFGSDNFATIYNSLFAVPFPKTKVNKSG